MPLVAALDHGALGEFAVGVRELTTSPPEATGRTIHDCRRIVAIIDETGDGG